MPAGARPGRALAALAAVLLVLLTGCAGAYVDPEPEPYRRAPQDLRASIVYAVWDRKQVPSIRRVVDAFRRHHPGIEVTVEVTPLSQYWTKLRTQAADGQLPDVFWMNAEYIDLYASHGKLAPVTGAVDAGDLDPARYPRELVDLYTYDGVRYGMPRDFDTIGLWVNKEVFRRAGVPLPGPDMTWEQFRDTGARISRALGPGNGHGAASDLSDSQSSYYGTIFQAGGSVIDAGRSMMDTPQARAGLRFWRDLIDSGASPTFPQMVDSPAESRFTSGRLAMYITGSWFRAGLDEDLARDVTVLPLPRGERRANVIHGLADVVAASSPNQQAAQAFQSFLGTEEAARTLGADGTVIPAYSGTQDGFVDSLPPEAGLQSLIDAAGYSRPLPASLNTGEWRAVEEALLPEAFAGTRTVEDVTAELAPRVDRILATEKEEAARD